jgi:MFS family permease
LAILQFVVGIANSFFNPASSGAIRDFVGASRMQEARSLLGISGSTVRIIGPAIAGFIVATSSAGIALALDALTFFISAAFLAQVRLPAAPLEFTSTIREDLAEGWNEVRSRSWVWGYILLACLFQATMLPALGILGPVISKESLGGVGAWAVVLSVESAGTLLSGFILLKWRPRYLMRAAVILCIFTLPLVFVLAIPGVQLAWLIIPAFIWGATLPMGDNLWFVALAEHIPDRSQSRVSSYDWLGSLALAPVGFWLMGHLAELGNPTTILVSVGVLNLGISLLILRLRGIRQLQRLDAEESHS